MKFRKVIAGIVTAAMAMSCFGFSALPSNASTNENTVQLGDVHGNDGVTTSDATYIIYYLEGRYEATAKQVTAMDVNQDGLIDSRDATTLLSMIASGAAFPIVHYVYENPHDELIEYRRHTCSLTDTTSSTSYTLHRNSVSSTESFLAENEVLSKVDESTNNRSTFLDYENIGSVELVITNADNSISHASGFVVGENVVATSAKALYKNGFAKSVTVNVYDSICFNIIDSADAETIHIPEDYVVLGGDPNKNYDYGLVYLGNDTDFSDYTVNLGVMTSKFLKFDSSDTNNYELTTSGFVSGSRYFNYGYVQLISNTNERKYRFHSLGESREGGMVYSGFTTSTKRVVGISNYIGSEDEEYEDEDNIDRTTYGIRITPTLLRFYLQNDELS